MRNVSSVRDVSSVSNVSSVISVSSVRNMSSLSRPPTVQFICSTACTDANCRNTPPEANSTSNICEADPFNFSGCNFKPNYK